MINIDKGLEDNDSNVVLVKCATAMPGECFAEITAYTVTTKTFTVIQPTANGLSIEKLVYVPFGTQSNETTLGYLGGVHLIQKDAVTAYAYVGTKAGSWTAGNFNTFPTYLHLTGIKAVFVMRQGVQSGVRRAFVKTTPGAVNHVVCWLSDTDGTGAEITVYCDIHGGAALSAAFPRLIDGDSIAVYQDLSGVWRCCTTFNYSCEAATEVCA